MTDAQLIRAVAELWVENGGDVEGISWCVQRIKDEVAAVIKERHVDE